METITRGRIRRVGETQKKGKIKNRVRGSNSVSPIYASFGVKAKRPPEHGRKNTALVETKFVAFLNELGTDRRSARFLGT